MKEVTSLESVVLANSVSAPKFALAGNPNCGKTALFNALTGSRQKVGNYPGVTVERKEGKAKLPSGETISILDLPGTYSLDAKTPDEMVTRDVLLGMQQGEPVPEVVIAVADATNLDRSLGLILELKQLGQRCVLALNMMDLADNRGVELDLEALEAELGMKVIPTIAVTGKGIPELLKEVRALSATPRAAAPVEWRKPSAGDIRARFAEVDRILKRVSHRKARPTIWTDRIDRVVMHPFFGSVLLVTVLAFVFQAIFTWAEVPIGWIESGVSALAQWVAAHTPDGPLRSMLVDGAITGVGAVVVFLPQILLLFFFILLLEDSGYMARAAFLMDRLMGRVGLQGRAFIPLLSSYACAIPGIMATRTIASRHDRFTTILIAPLMTCSARLPVYALLIGAFFPNTPVWGPFKLQGLVMLGLYAAGIVAALFVAVIMRRTVLKGPKSPLVMELPTYKWPSVRGLALGLLERATVFLRRAGTVILSLSILLWFVASYPKPGPTDVIDAEHPAISYSFAGQLGHVIEPVMRPLGFDWRASIALIPAFAAREVMVTALATVYSIEGGEDQVLDVLGSRLSKDWGVPVALSLLIWFVLACQCASTLAVTRRETNSWRWPAVMFGYMTVLAYVGSFITYRLAIWAGL